jgi:glycosyltransferase involved in cell wall biosynthesis
MTQISAAIITLNEERNIAECILSLRDVVDEIVVLDSGSSDKTREIAESLGAKVFIQKYLGDGFQKNLAINKSTNNWVISLDADERASEQLRNFLRERKFNTGFAYSFRRKNHVSERWIKYGDAYPDRLVRLFEKSISQYTAVIEHAAVCASSVVERNEDILHYGTPSISDMYEKSIKFAKRSAKKLLISNAKAKNPLISGSWLFFRLYVLKLGFMGGRDSFHHCLSAGLRSFYKYSFLNEYLSDPKVKRSIDTEKIW